MHFARYSHGRVVRTFVVRRQYLTALQAAERSITEASVID